MSKFFDKYLAPGPPQQNKKPGKVVLPSEAKATPKKAVSNEIIEAEIMRVVPLLCSKAETCRELRPKISAAIDELWHLEQSGPENLLRTRLHEIEKQFI